MPLRVNGVEIEHVIFKAPGINQEIDQLYANSTLVFESTIYVAKPTISGSYTFDNAAKSPTITGYDSAAMTKSGTESATAAGTYTVTFTLKKGYAWTDGTTAAVSLNWTIAKRSITIPSISNTSKTFNTAAQSPTISNVTSGYVTQSGTSSATNAGNYTVTWALKYPASTQWTDKTTANKTGSWSIAKRSITIPSLSNTSKTYNTNNQSPTISGVTSGYVTQSGTTTAKTVGTYTVTWALDYPTNTTWSDGKTANKTANWTIGRMSITVPSLSGTTSFTFVQGNTHSVTVANRNATWVNQSGDTSVTDGASGPVTKTITWTLVDTANTQWSGGGTGNKTATWKTVWTNGTSHYTNDLYNNGWYKTGVLSFPNGDATWNADHFYTNVINLNFCTAGDQTGTFHASVKITSKDSASVYTVDVRSGSNNGYTNQKAFTANNSTYIEVSATHGSGSNYTRFGIRTGNALGLCVERVWMT